MGLFDFLKKVGGTIFNGVKRVGGGVYSIIRKGANAVSNTLGTIRDGVKSAINTVSNIPVLGQILKQAASIPIPMLRGMSLGQVLSSANQGIDVVKKLNDVVQGRPVDAAFLQDFVNLPLSILQGKYPGLNNSSIYQAAKDAIKTGVSQLPQK